MQKVVMFHVAAADAVKPVCLNRYRLKPEQCAARVGSSRQWTRAHSGVCGLECTWIHILLPSLDRTQPHIVSRALKHVTCAQSAWATILGRFVILRAGEPFFMLSGCVHRFSIVLMLWRYHHIPGRHPACGKLIDYGTLRKSIINPQAANWSPPPFLREKKKSLHTEIYLS